MGGPGNCTRRSLLALATSWLIDRGVGGLLAQQAAVPTRPVDSARALSRHYAVHATVILGSIPIFTKRKVGGALLTVEETGASDRSAVALQFGAGSWPDRLHGFNRLGMTQEVVRIERGQLTETSYLSFMTSSREASFSQAEAAFRSKTERLPITVAYGRSTAAGYSTALRHDAVAANLSWSDCPKLIDDLRARMTPVAESRAERSGAVLATFLYAVRHNILQGERDSTAMYTHNGETYRLRTEVRRDSRSGGTVVTGHTWRDGTHGESQFRLWFDRSENDLPLRIEFRPKSYLRLTLEPDESQTVPVFKRMFQETLS